MLLLRQDDQRGVTGSVDKAYEDDKRKRADTQTLLAGIMKKTVTSCGIRVVSQFFHVV